MIELRIEKGIPLPGPPPMAMRAELGLCPCGREPKRQGYARGERCAAKHRANTSRQYKDHRAAGLCGYGSCRKPAAHGSSMCLLHLKRNTQHIQELLNGRVENGLCRRCGKRPILGTANYCLICYGAIGGKDSDAPKHPLPGSIRELIRQFWRLDRIDARRAAAEAAIEHLRDERLRQVIALRHGLTDGIDHTLEDVGVSMDVTRERVRQIENKAYGILAELGVDITFRKFSDIQRPSVNSGNETRHKVSDHEQRISLAHRLVKHALKSGEIVRKSCERADCEYAGKSIAHHEDYDKPLDVIWLCPPHHSEAHGKKRVTGVFPKHRYLFPAWLEKASAETSADLYDAPRIIETFKRFQLLKNDALKATGVTPDTLFRIVRGLPVSDKQLLPVLKYVESLEQSQTIAA